MHAGKALLLVVLGGLVLAAGLFTAVPSTRPTVVQGWFRHLYGYPPAKTPTEALDRFRDAIKKRDYETAALFTDKEYKEQMLKVAPQAKKLADAIESLQNAMDKHGVNNPKVKAMLRLLEPFPKSFKVVEVKEKDNNATARITDDDPISTSENLTDFINKHGNMLGTLQPNTLLESWGMVNLVKDAEGWKIQIPVTPRIRAGVDALKDHGTNYANGIKQVSDSVKNNPTTKEAVQSELDRALNESK